MEVPKPINLAESLDNNLAFVLKLAEGDVDDEESLIKNIAEIIEKTIRETSRPEFLDRLDPDSYHPETKLLSNRGKERLNRAINIFTDKYN